MSLDFLSIADEIRREFLALPAISVKGDTSNTEELPLHIPFDKGDLYNMLADPAMQLGANEFGFEMLTHPDAFYGVILNEAPSIKYRIRYRRGGGTRQTKATGEYVNATRVHKNKHYMFIDKFFDDPAVELFASLTGSKFVGKEGGL